jgi:hypothetical protein
MDERYFIPMKADRKGATSARRISGFVLVPVHVDVSDGEEPKVTTHAGKVGPPFEIAKLILPPKITSLGKEQTLREYINSIGLPWEEVAFEDISYPGPRSP